jgi:PAS domain S-box-containing protein
MIKNRTATILPDENFTPLNFESFENFPDGVAVTNTDGILVYCSSRLLNMMGHPSNNQCIGEPILKFLMPEERYRAKENLRLLHSGFFSKAYEYRGNQSNGSPVYLDVHASVISGQAPGELLILFSIRNINHRRKTFLNPGKEVDKSQLEEELKRKISELTGVYQLSSLIQQKDYSFEETIRQIPSLIQSVFRDPPQTGVRIRIGSNDYKTDAYFDASTLSITRNIIQQNKTVGSLTITLAPELNDTDSDDYLKEKQEVIDEFAYQIGRFIGEDQLKRDLLTSIEKAEKNDQVKTLFLQMISHEIRTPLNGILGFSDLLTQTEISQHEREEYLTLLKLSSNRLITTMSDIIDASLLVTKTMVSKRSVVSVDVLLAPLVKKYSELAKFHSLYFNYHSQPSTDPVEMLTDPELLEKALSHLLHNGIKFTKVGGVNFSYTIIDHTIGFKITDTGIGFDPELLPVVFEPFSQLNDGRTRQFEGVGLGLLISKGCLDILGGTIRIESRFGAGTQVYLTLPYQGRSPVEAFRRQGSADNIILIVEDEFVNRLYMEAILKRSANTLLFAETGREAVNQCRKHPEITMILMDLKLPEMDGLTATRLIRQFKPNIPIIAVTAFSDAEDKIMAYNAGCDGYLTKPFLEHELLAIIQKFERNQWSEE